MTALLAILDFRQKRRSKEYAPSLDASNFRRLEDRSSNSRLAAVIAVVALQNANRLVRCN